MSDKKLFGKYTPPIYDQHYAAVRNIVDECPSAAGCSAALADNVIDLLQEVIYQHADPKGADYNECDKPENECLWCQEAKNAIAELKR